MALHRKTATDRDTAEESEHRSTVDPIFARAGEATGAPTHVMPGDGMRPDTAYQVVHDELMLDGNARMNLATFVTTWMDPQAEKLMAECLDKNMIDKDEYPQTAELEMRCVNILANLWHARGDGDAIGCSTTGFGTSAFAVSRSAEPFGSGGGGGGGGL